MVNNQFILGFQHAYNNIKNIKNIKISKDYILGYNKGNKLREFDLKKENIIILQKQIDILNNNLVI
tara:strand:- start:1896 stop:2093 length:198 start_codon:yes stop_codon:yes gene_type:complete